MVKISTKKEFEDILNENEGKTVILKFGAEWCGPCKVMETTINNVEKQGQTNAVFVECDVDEADEKDPDFLEENKVMNIPLMLFYKDKLIYDRTVGLLSSKELMGKIKK